MPPTSRRQRVPIQHNFTSQIQQSSRLYGRQTSSRPRQASRQSRSSSGRLKLYAVLVGLFLLTFSGHNLWSKHASAQELANQQAKTTAAAEAKQRQLKLASQVNALIDATQADVSVAIATDDNTQVLGEKAAFDGASTAKLLTAADYLHHTEEGTASLDRRIDGQSARHWLKAMVVDSDDTAWAELNTYLTHNDLARYAESIGFTDYNYTDNTFTAADVSRLLQKLYAGQLLNDANRSLLLGYMKQANYRQYIVSAVPPGDTVYHKVGFDNDTVNDAAVITHGDHYVVLTIFTNGHGSYDWDARQQLIQDITKDVVAAYL